MWSLPEKENVIGSVAIEILSFRQNSLPTLYDRTSGYTSREGLQFENPFFSI